MPLRIPRRPFTACAYRWSMSITAGDVADGEGSVSDAQCLDLAGDFNLDFKACDSNGESLVWASPCEPSVRGTATTCKVDGCEEFASSRIPWDPPSVTTPTDATWTVTRPFSGVLNGGFFDGCCAWFDSMDIDITTTDPDGVTWPPPALGGFNNFSPYVSWTRTIPDDGLYHSYMTITAAFTTAREVLFTFSITDNAAIFAVGFGLMEVFSAAENGCGPYSLELSDNNVDRFVCSVVATHSRTETGVVLSSPFSVVPGDSSTGPDTSGRIRSKWHLEYIIDEQAWILRSFNRLQYPTYYLHDEDPCEGETKILTLLTHSGSETNGCGTAPESITLTRECAPERPARDRKRNKITGQLKHGCGCDCQDEVDDRRTTAKCEGTGTTGCETYDETGITCKYPKSADCCDYCEEDKAPCAYEALFDCDIEYEGSKIAAKVVTLRHECYFSEGAECDWVAVGPSGNVQDGGLGAQPVCATCSDLCLTGCSWSSWQVAECPDEPVLCDLVADKTKCLEFRWYEVQSTGFTPGDAAAVLSFTSETIDALGIITWIFTSDDGEWVATLHPNTRGNPRVWCAQGVTFCGSGGLLWNNPPVGFPNNTWPSNEWMTETFDTDFVCDNNGIADDGIFFDGNEFGSLYTTLRLYWIDCP